MTMTNILGNGIMDIMWEKHLHAHPDLDKKIKQFAWDLYRTWKQVYPKNLKGLKNFTHHNIYDFISYPPASATISTAEDFIKRISVHLDKAKPVLMDTILEGNTQPLSEQLLDLVREFRQVEVPDGKNIDVHRLRWHYIKSMWFQIDLLTFAYIDNIGIG